MKKALKWIGIACLTPCLLFIALTALFYFPPFQQWMVNRVAEYASRQAGMEITVERVRLSFPLDLRIENLLALRSDDLSANARDTVAHVETMTASVQLLPLFSGKVELDALELNAVTVDTGNLIDAARVKGRLGRLYAESHPIDLKAELVRLNTGVLEDADLLITLPDSVPPDTTKSENHWHVLVDKLNVMRSNVAVSMSGDTIRAQMRMGELVAEQADLDLDKAVYQLRSVSLADGKLNYDNLFAPETAGFDYNHVALDGVKAQVDSIYYCDSKLSLSVRSLSFKEQCGLQVNAAEGKVSLDNDRLVIPQLKISTSESALTASINMPLDAFSAGSRSELSTTLHASLGKNDVMRFIGNDIPAAVRRQYPNYPIAIDGVVRGNMNQVYFHGLTVKLPTAFQMKASGYITNYSDPDRMSADVDLHAKTYNLKFVNAMLDPSLRKTVNIPSGISLDGNIKASGQHYTANITAREGSGTVHLVGKTNLKTQSYQANIVANGFPLQHFLPSMGLSPLTGKIAAHGTGFDFLSPKTHLEAKAQIDRFTYSGYNLSGTKATATVSNGHARADIDSRNNLVDGHVAINATLGKNKTTAVINSDIRGIDLYALKIADTPLSVSLRGNVTVASDMRDSYEVHGNIDNLVIHERNSIYNPGHVTFALITNKDTTGVVVNSRDFALDIGFQGGYKKLIDNSNRLLNELQRQYAGHRIDQKELRKYLPQGHLYLNSGTDNILTQALNYYGVNIKSADCDMQFSPVTGINGSMKVDSLVVNDMQLDDISLSMASSEDNIEYHIKVQNNDKNPQYTFTALADGTIYEHGTHVSTTLLDDKGKTGVALELTAEMENDGLRIRSDGQNPILGYKEFAVNSDNYIVVNSQSSRISANVKLRADDGAGIQIYTDDLNEDVSQDITFSINKFNIEKVLSVIPYTPSVSGMLDGDFHFVQAGNTFTVSSDVAVDKLVYEGCEIGNISTEFVYMPKDDDSHYINGILYSDGEEVASVVGTYQAAGEGFLDAELTLDRLPLSYVNGFIPDQLFGLNGYGEGQLSVRGKPSSPQIDGEVYLDSAYLISVPYGLNLRFDDDPVIIKNSRLLFENFEVYAYNDSPLTIAGYLDFSSLDRMMLDIRMRARNYQIINAKETHRSEVYGKAFVNFFGTLKGYVDDLQMRGRLDLLGATDMTYILRDSPLSTGNPLDGLVEFTDFRDTTKVVTSRPPLTGFDVDLTLSIDESARILCALNPDKSNYIDLVGGGNLRLRYNQVENLWLTGRYTLSNGEMKYSLPIIPLKTFTIQDGSYLDFTGDVMNPTLNITATERVKAPVSSESGTGRSVQFECGVVLSKTLQDMGLEFIIDAPEDISLRSELLSMTPEERGKLAVTLLTTGMYLADGNTSAFSMNAALNSFLQGQISAISGNALRTLDLSFDLDNSTDASGRNRTDYSFKFAKRFWNNRLKVSLGGKVTSGTETQGQDVPFFSDVALEYRLGDTSNRYLRLFYNRDSYDWLDGYVGEYGGGFMWKRKVRHFKELFKFKNEDERIRFKPNQSDSIKNASMKQESKPAESVR